MEEFYMWIGKEEYNKLLHDSNLLKRLKIQLKPSSIGNSFGVTIDEYEKIIKKFQPETTSYAERFEYWKKHFDKKPEMHKLRIDWENNYEFIEGLQLCYLAEELEKLKAQKEFIEILDKETEQIIHVPVNKVISYTIIPGHPEPYTNDEINAWVKEQLDNEMKDWKIIKEDKQYDSPFKFGIKFKS
jgi:hypothetical protein